ncbi:DNA-3-methyladenine glycosidase [Marinobacterium nitratireducens]|uniref:DNA-3-methyladenine glycosylase II n=1 Tax=Marinobacterium nitratireducens TaxID=518897 RepID=A0A917ZAA0_9GAMM|nr:DNA-3-methyladenine glycosylase 2 family protein [Marinobacterium nitratireducens]GGO79016.1 DNA-3-methyladenine glycosidase [Marinobacterium nitratireducens]
MDHETIARAMAAIAASDEDVARALEQLGPPPPRQRPVGFETFLATIVSQQLATQAAQAILGRVQALMGEPTPRGLLGVEDEALRAAGLSLRKIEYAKGLARAVDEGRFDIAALETMSDDEAIGAITALRGFGRWSAEIYLMFSQQRPDLFPADDLALRVALGRLKGLESRPTPQQARVLVEPWSPWRSVGSLFLWHYYRGAPA